MRYFPGIKQILCHKRFLRFLIVALAVRCFFQLKAWFLNLWATEEFLTSHGQMSLKLSTFLQT